MVDEEIFASLRSEAAAEQVAAFLKRLQKQKPANRMQCIESYCKAIFSTKVMEERLQLYSETTAYLQAACYSLLFFLFLLAPGVIRFLGFSRSWLALLLYLLLCMLAILWMFRRAHRRIYPNRTAWPVQQITTLALSPFAAVRANDLLVADLLSEFHPVAVAWKLLPEQDFLAFAGAELRVAQFLHHDEFLGKLIRGFLAEKGHDPEILLRAPARENSSSQAYCPVCLTQYVTNAGTCQDCDNTPLLKFPDA